MNLSNVIYRIRHFFPIIVVFITCSMTNDDSQSIKNNWEAMKGKSLPEPRKVYSAVQLYCKDKREFDGYYIKSFQFSHLGDEDFWLISVNMSPAKNGLNETLELFFGDDLKPISQKDALKLTGAVNN